MSTPLYTDLVTNAQVKDGLMGSFSATVLANLEDNTKDEYAACVDVIQDVTDEIAHELDRVVIVRSVTQRVPAGLWLYNRLLDAYVVWAAQWPVVEIKSVVDADGVAISGMTVERERPEPGAEYHWLKTTTPQDCRVTYYAGYRRSDQNLAGLQTSLADLTVLPDELPGTIRRVALRLVVAELRQQILGLVGVGRTSKQIDQMTVESTAAAPVVFMAQSQSVHEKELQRLAAYRRSGAT